MPQFEMSFADQDDAVTFQQLDQFTQGYVTAMFFTECNSDTPELQDATFGDLAPKTLDKIIADCAAFQDKWSGLLSGAYHHATVRYDAERAGIDYWLTRNGHGAGYWDRGLGTVGDALAEAARRDGEQDIYKGDDGRLYVS